jgi:dihydroorotase
MNVVIKNGKTLQQNGELQSCDIKIEKGIITEISTSIYGGSLPTWDAKGLLVAPGFVDLHVHLREPGGEKKETIETGTKAAARGGFTTIATMPNTRPIPDNKAQMTLLQEKIKSTASVRVLPYASITTRQLGNDLTEMDQLLEAGAFAFTDDGVGIQNANMMLKAMKRAKQLGASIVAHCEENTLIHGGVMHDGKVSKELNMPGIPSVCESVQIARDVLLSEATGCHYHVCHISTKESVRVVRDAKIAGINVTAEVTPHHLLLTEEDIHEDDALYKMNPPLRSKEDRDALIEGLLDGTIDFIATDHAPHTEEEKAEGMKLAPFGIVGLETAFSLLYTHFVQKEIFTLQQLINWMTSAPSKAFKLPYGQLEVGSVADLVVLDLIKKEEIDPSKFASKGRNTPFKGWTVCGWPVATFVEGKQVFEGRVEA